jgi:hypothetical protein
MERKDVIERAYQLINTPIDPNLKCPVALEDIVNYRESEAGETVEYFASPAQDRGDTVISVADGNGHLTYNKIGLKTVLPLTFIGIQSQLETILLDEIMNSKDQTALAAKKDGIIRSMDNKEIYNVMNLCLGAGEGQEIDKVTGEDLLDVIIRMKQLISDYSTDYVLIVAADVSDKIESYDKDNVTTFEYSFPIVDQLARLGIKKVVKVLGTIGDGSTKVLANGLAILVGRNSNIATGGQRPVTMLRRKFGKETAELSGATEGAVRLVDVAKTPTIIDATYNVLGYGVFGYESVIQVLLNPRAVAWTDNILASL